MKPVLKYRGGKNREIPEFAQYIPNNFDTYIEPFVGGGAVFFHLEPRKAIINDINQKLVTFYRELQNMYPEMRIQLDLIQSEYEINQKHYVLLKNQHPNMRVPNQNEELYYRLRELYNHPDGTIMDGVLYYFINKTAYSGMIRYNSNGEYNVPFGRYSNFNTQLLKKEHSDLLQNAQIFNTDYRNIFEMAKDNDFMFLDPPYDCVFNDYGNLDALNGFDEGEHIRLAEAFKNLQCRALMIIGRTPLTERLYGDYVVGEYYKNYAVNIKNRFNSETVHMIVCNY